MDHILCLRHLSSRTHPCQRSYLRQLDNQMRSSGSSSQTRICFYLPLSLQIISAVDYCHRMDLALGGLQAENILVAMEGEYPIAKIHALG